MKKVKILALHLAYGGVEKAIANMANVFVEKYDVEIVSVYKAPKGIAYAIDSKVTITYLTDLYPNKAEFKAALHSFNIIKTIKEGIKSIKILREKKAVTHKAIVDFRDCIVISTRNEYSLELSKYGDNSVYKIAQLHHDHSFNPKLIEDFTEGYNNIDVFALLTPQLVEEVQEMLKGKEKPKCKYVPNFIEELPSDIKMEDKKDICIAVGRAHKVKGFERLIDIFYEVHKQSPNTILQIIGDGEEIPNLEKKIRELNLKENVFLLGQRTSEEIETYMKRASIYLMTSYTECLPFVLIESSSCKLVSVAYDVRVGPRAIVDHNLNGYLIKDGDQSDYVSAVLTLIKNDNLRKELAEQAYIKARQFTKENVKEIWFDILK
ncbi:MAG: glycosyltransferase [Erysipelotrichaceae bacterium]